VSVPGNQLAGKPRLCTLVEQERVGRHSAAGATWPRVSVSFLGCRRANLGLQVAPLRRQTRAREALRFLPGTVVREQHLQRKGEDLVQQRDGFPRVALREKGLRYVCQIYRHRRVVLPQARLRLLRYLAALGCSYPERLAVDREGLAEELLCLVELPLVAGHDVDPVHGSGDRRVVVVRAPSEPQRLLLDGW